MTRKPISKKLRFEVFKRDGFRCAYCGKFPPAVILEVDHIEPIMEHLKKAVGIAYAKQPNDMDQAIKYFCGVCWCKIRGDEAGQGRRKYYGGRR